MDEHGVRRSSRVSDTTPATHHTPCRVSATERHRVSWRAVSWWCCACPCCSTELPAVRLSCRRANKRTTRPWRR
jgi:hypothetical protein